jgi:hypothetical protein
LAAALTRTVWDEKMEPRKTTEFVHEGRLVVEVDVSLIETDSAWSPYYSIQDVRKLEAAREALRRGDLEAAKTFGRVYEMKPVAAE